VEGIYDKENALVKIKNLYGFDDGNSRTNLLWWIHSRGNEEVEGCGGGGKHGWFLHYCH
jgi:endo-1,3(4)-beta-glucanase